MLSGASGKIANSKKQSSDCFFYYVLLCKIIIINVKIYLALSLPKDYISVVP